MTPIFYKGRYINRLYLDSTFKFEYMLLYYFRDVMTYVEFDVNYDKWLLKYGLLLPNRYFKHFKNNG